MKIYVLILMTMLTGCWKPVPIKKSYEFYQRTSFSREYFFCRRDTDVRYAMVPEMLSLDYEDAVKSCDYFLDK